VGVQYFLAPVEAIMVCRMRSFASGDIEVMLLK
jgi:hypothetical protein